jgi:hypothetical protein
MTITTDFDIGDEVKLNNGEKGRITSIRIVIREGKTGGDYKIEYEVDHTYIRYSYQLNKIY